MKKAIIVTCFESNEERVTFIKEALKNKEYDVNVITTNFSHIKKEERKDIPKGFIPLKTIYYRKNLSITRLFSHAQFAVDSFFLLDEMKPDLLWILAPCNSLIKETKKYKKKHKNVKVIIDIIDMWPESLPIAFKKKDLFIFKWWKDIRTNNIDVADEVVSECDLYQEILSKEYQGRITTIHWARDAKAIKHDTDLPSDKLSLCYIGSINNIIDIDLIKKLISNTNKKVVIHIIGSGEQTKYMLNTLKEVCEVVYHNNVYDAKEKENIFNQCHAGINIYKEGLYIGLTVKCMDYFMYGLPIINNIKGDTWNFVENNKVGVNVNKDTIIDANKLINTRSNNQNVIDLFNNNFTKEIFINKCYEVIDRINNK